MTAMISPSGRRPVIARTAELEAFAAWLHSPSPYTTVCSIRGYGGVGKTTLMSQMAQSARQHGHVVVWVEGQACEHTPAGFLDYLQMTAYGEYVKADTGKDAHSPGPSNSSRFVICIDDYELLTGIEGWLLEDFVHRLPPGTLLVIASRTELSTRWLSHPTLTDHLTEIRLNNFTRAQVLQYLEYFHDMDEELREDIARITKGHPLSLALASQQLYESASRQDIESAIAQTVSGNLLREQLAPSMQPALDLLSIVGSADYITCSSCLGPTFTLEQYHSLANLSFVRFTPNGIAIHDLARNHLLTDLRIRAPLQYEEMRQKLMQILCDKLEASSGQVRHQAAIQLLNLCLYASPIRPRYADLTVDPRTHQMGPCTADDKLRLLKILHDWCSYSVDPARPHRIKLYHDFFDEAFDSYPETFRVVRTPDGNPVAMMIRFLLYDETYAFLSQYFADELKECGTREELGCRAEEANTYYVVLGAYDTDCTVYSGEELVGACALDSMALLSDNTRIILVANNPDLKATLTQIGFDMRRAQTTKCDTQIHEAHVLSLDFREGKFIHWIKQFGVFSDTKTGAGKLLEPPITEAELREALKVMNDPTRLGESSMAVRLHMGGLALQRHLQQIIHDAFNSPDAPQEQARVIEATYHGHYRTPTNAAMLCHMSRATYYRHLNVAIHYLIRYTASMDEETPD